MERYLIRSSTTPDDIQEANKNKRAAKHAPYSIKDRPAGKRGVKPEFAQSSKTALNKYILATLKDETNPVTHSEAVGGDHVVPWMKQEPGQSGRPSYQQERTRKLKEQIASDEPGRILVGVRAYLSGYLEGTTDIVLKRIITDAGGQVLRSDGQATHVITSQHLSKSKAEKHLKAKIKKQKRIVKPEWVTDSVAAGRKLAESKYRLEISPHLG